MVTADTQALREREAARGGTGYLTDVAETIRDDALKQARTELGSLAGTLDLEELFNRPAFVERFTYSMAKAAALAIAANDQRVEQVYLFEVESNLDVADDAMAHIDTSVHLLAVVNPPSAALESFIAALDRSLAHSLRELGSELFRERETVLDVKLISERDVPSSNGYAVLLRSIHAPALKIWEREGA